jgi:hypothetical protein
VDPGQLDLFEERVAVAKYAPDQPRADNGQFGEGGGEGGDGAAAAGGDSGRNADTHRPQEATRASAIRSGDIVTTHATVEGKRTSFRGTVLDATQPDEQGRPGSYHFRVLESQRPGLLSVGSEITVRIKPDRDVMIEAAKRDDGDDGNPIPLVLRWSPTGSAPMPPDGQSGLPASLEQDVPPEFRYWTAKGDEARAARDALVESDLFTRDSIRLVDGVPRRVVVELYLPAIEKAAAESLASPASREALLEKLVPAPSILSTKAEDLDAALRLLPDGAAIHVVVALSDAENIAPIVKALQEKGAPWLVEVPDEVPCRLMLDALGIPFHLRSTKNDGAAFLSSFDPAIPVEWLDGSAVAAKKDDGGDDAVAGEALRRVTRVIKGADPKDERYVLGIVLEPETEDSQKDIYSAEEIRQAAHKFMETYGSIGLMHKVALGGRVAILESWIAPCDFDLNGQHVKKGTWMLAIRVKDDDLWDSVKKGELTGFSIGGSAIRRPEKQTS